MKTKLSYDSTGILFSCHDLLRGGAVDYDNRVGVKLTVKAQ